MTRVHSVLAVLAAGSLAAGCSDIQGARPKAVRPVKTQAVALSAPPTGIHYSATIEAFEQVPLAFKSSGYVDQVLRRPGADGRLRTAQPGDLVSKGTVLARVREAEYRERVAQGRSKVAEAEASLEKARLDLERARTLFAAESLIKPDLDAAQASFDSSRARLAGAQADVELAEVALRDCALVSPATGVLLERQIEAGALVGTGTVGFVIGDITAVKARFGIPDGMIQSVTPGERIDLLVDTLGGASFEGRVTAVAPAADPDSRVFDVEVTIPNPDGRLRPGMIGTAAVTPVGAAAQPSLAGLTTVPLTAIVRSATGGYAAFTIEQRGDEEVARMRQVELGDVVGNQVAVRRGLDTGERVVVTGATLLVDGEVVKVIP